MYDKSCVSRPSCQVDKKPLLWHTKKQAMNRNPPPNVNYYKQYLDQHNWQYFAIAKFQLWTRNIIPNPSITGNLATTFPQNMEPHLEKPKVRITMERSLRGNLCGMGFARKPRCTPSSTFLNHIRTVCAGLYFQTTLYAQPMRDGVTL